MPELNDGDTGFKTSYLRSLEEVGVEDVESFWNLEPGLFDAQQRRLVLPAAIAFLKR
jgi:hypothetical protein